MDLGPQINRLRVVEQLVVVASNRVYLRQHVTSVLLCLREGVATLGDHADCRPGHQRAWRRLQPVAARFQGSLLQALMMVICSVQLLERLASAQCMPLWDALPPSTSRSWQVEAIISCFCGRPFAVPHSKVSPWAAWQLAKLRTALTSCGSSRCSRRRRPQWWQREILE